MASSSRYRDNELIAEIGLRIRKARVSQGMSQQTLANHCDIELSTINRIELGKLNPTISILYLICNTLGVDPTEILIVGD